MERDIVGRLLIHAMEKKIDLQEVFKFPLSPVPLVFGQVDGSLNKTQKSSLYKNIER